MWNYFFHRAQGKLDFTEAFIEGMHAFDYIKRPGRQFDSRYIGAEISEIACPENMPLKIFNKISLLVKAVVTALKEVWDEARLKEVDPNRIGLIIGGSKFQQRELLQLYEKYRGHPQFVSPTHCQCIISILSICNKAFLTRISSQYDRKKG
jgi:malonyl-ACP decarboxylase